MNSSLLSKSFFSKTKFFSFLFTVSTINSNMLNLNLISYGKQTFSTTHFISGKQCIVMSKDLKAAADDNISFKHLLFSCQKFLHILNCEIAGL